MARRSAPRPAGAPPRPTPADLRAAEGKVIQDVIAPGLRVLFCGINPGLWSGATGHHFAKPGNRFWPALHASGFTDRRLQPWEERELLAFGLGVTNVVRRTTATAAELDPHEYVAGGRRLAAKVKRHAPRLLAVLGIGAYRTAFARPRATLGLQDERLGDTRLWVLPNPSGLNAHYQQPDLTAVYARLREALE